MTTGGETAATAATTSSPPPLICVADDCAGTPVCLTVFDLGRQLLVWGWAGNSGGGGPPPLGSVALGVPPLHAGAPLPAAATLAPGAGDDAASRALAARLASRLGRPVAVAWHVGGGGSGDGPDGALGAWAERRLVEELKRTGHWPESAGGGGGRG